MRLVEHRPSGLGHGGGLITAWSAYETRDMSAISWIVFYQVLGLFSYIASLQNVNCAGRGRARLVAVAVTVSVSVSSCTSRHVQKSDIG